MKTILFVVLLAGSLLGCATARQVDGERDEATLESEGAAARAAGDYEKLIELALPKARAGDAEYQFAVGYSMLEWLAAPDATAVPKHSAADALEWIYKAAKGGVPQAAAVLSSAYRFGDFSLPKNSDLEECWRKVEIDEQPAAVCLVAEEKLRQR